MGLDEIQTKIEKALEGTSGYEESVLRLEAEGFSDRDSMALAGAHHGFENNGVRESQSE